jgi:phage-related tail protein
MASQATRRQFAICAMLQGFAEAMVKNGLANEAFTPLHDDAVNACTKAFEFIEKESGKMNERELAKATKALDKFYDLTFVSGTFTGEQAMSLVICLIVDRLGMINNKAKKRVFEAMLHCAENILAYFDPEWDYSGCEGYSAAQIFEMLEL